MEARDGFMICFCLNYWLLFDLQLFYDEGARLRSPVLEKRVMLGVLPKQQ
jgi:hypothetical protein